MSEAEVKRRGRPPKGVMPPQLRNVDRLANVAKANATRRANRAKKLEQAAALKNAALIERQLREAQDPDRFKLGNAAIMEQIRTRMLTAIELADIQAREEGHAHGLASLMAADLKRNPTGTLVAWSKLLPTGGGGGGGGGEGNTSQHLDAVRALTMASTAAGRVAQLAVDLVEKAKAPEIELNAVDIS